MEQSDHTKRPSPLCRDPVLRAGLGPIPKCMELISVEAVVAAVRSYYNAGTIPPLGIPVSPVCTLARTPVTEPFAQPSHDTKTADPRVIRQLEPLAILDHPHIGGKFTFFTLCYGPHTDLAIRCLNSVLSTVPAERLDIRVATNAASPATLTYLQSLPLTKLYVNHSNRFKYPVMREMFWDELCPIRTKYLIWFDDDSYATDPQWIGKLAQTIVDNHQHNHRLYGIKFLHDLTHYSKSGHRPELWFQQAPWYKGVQLLAKGTNRPAPNGSLLSFVAGGFFALGVDALHRGDIPDRRLRHNGGDCCIGEQVHQAGYGIKDFNRNKAYVYSSGAPRRGYHEDFPWSKPENQLQGSYLCPDT